MFFTDLQLISYLEQKKFLFKKVTFSDLLFLWVYI